MTEFILDADGKQIPNPDYKKGTQDGELVVDYKIKFSESTKEYQRIDAESKAKDVEIARLAALVAKENEPNPADNNLFPGFENLDQDAQENLINYTKTVEDRVKNDLFKDPAIAFARQSFNEKKWNDAFDKVASTIPELSTSREDFKNKYFKVNNVPDNIENILTDISKIYLFDKVKDIGIREEKERESNRIDSETGNGGDKSAPTGRSLDEWQTLQKTNPAKFATEYKKFNEDYNSGKLRE